MPMLWVVTGTTFVLSAIVALALVYSFTEKQATVAERLSTLSDPDVDRSGGIVRRETGQEGHGRGGGARPE